MTTPADPVLARLAASERDGIERLRDWLRIPSISTDPAFKDRVREAAVWAADHLATSGFKAELIETGKPEGAGHPVVLAHCEGKPGVPRVLFYGHYDVQPADESEPWRHGPFNPAIEETEHGPQIVCRGASDDKGQVSSFLEAARAWFEETGLAAGGVPMTVLLEGEEESGSVNLERFLEEHKGKLDDCAVCVISDTGMLGRGKPAITTGIRGLTYTEVTLHGPSHDLHSGMWGGRIPNPANELCRILAQLHDADRKVNIPGFYDSVRETPKDELDAWGRLDFSEADALREIGLPPEAGLGEAGRNAFERGWARPTCDINGFKSGYIGEGAKTIIPAKATAKVSFRLVADQDPVQITSAFFQWLDERTPPGFRWEKHNHGGGWPATVSTDEPVLIAAMRAVKRACSVEPALIKTGGSIPVAGLLKRLLGIDTVFMGFGLDDDRVHSPNEKFDLECWRMGARSHAVLIEELLGLGAGSGARGAG